MLVGLLLPSAHPQLSSTLHPWSRDRLPHHQRPGLRMLHDLNLVLPVLPSRPAAVCGAQPSQPAADGEIQRSGVRGAWVRHDLDCLQSVLERAVGLSGW